MMWYGYEKIIFGLLMNCIISQYNQNHQVC
nr:MAG TPA: hypothetical protein [Caudoviricetes sp.]